MNCSPVSCPGLRALLLVVGLVVAGCGQPPSPNGSNPTSNGRKSVSALGKIEPLDGIIHLTAAPGDRVVHWSPDVKEGVEVKKGDELVVLESKRIRLQEKELAKTQHKFALGQLEAIKRNGDAQLAEAELKNARALKGLEQDVILFSKKVDLATKQHKVEEAAYESVKELTNGSVAAQDRDRQKLKMEAAELDLESAKIGEKKAIEAKDSAAKESKAQLDALRAAVKRANLEVEASVATAATNVYLAEKRYEDSKIKAPAAGVILSIHVHPGEVVGQRPLVRMGDTDKLAVIAEVDETDALRVWKGQKAVVTSRLFKVSEDSETRLKIPGEVSAVGKTIGHNSIDELNPAARADRRVVKVKIHLDLDAVHIDKNVRKQLADLINLQVDVEFLDQPQASDSSK